MVIEIVDEELFCHDCNRLANTECVQLDHRREMVNADKDLGTTDRARKTEQGQEAKRFNDHGQELGVCKHCAREVIALPKPHDDIWVHNNPARMYPSYCVLDTEAEPSRFPENISIEEAERALKEEGLSGAAVVNSFIERLLSERSYLRAAALAAIKALKLEFPGSIKRKEAIAQLEAALSPQKGKESNQ